MADEKYLTVHSTLAQRADGGHPVALWEVDPAHPEDASGNHEAFVAGPKPVQVADTPQVRKLIRDGVLAESGSKTSDKASKGE